MQSFNKFRVWRRRTNKAIRSGKTQTHTFAFTCICSFEFSHLYVALGFVYLFRDIAEHTLALEADGNSRGSGARGVVQPHGWKPLDLNMIHEPISHSMLYSMALCALYSMSFEFLLSADDEISSPSSFGFA